MRTILLVIVFSCFGNVLLAQNTIKTMFYNILMFPEEQQSFNRDLILREIINTYEPDIFMVCELQNQEGVDIILDVSLNDTDNLYAAPLYVSNTSSGSDLQQLVFYRQDKFTVEETDIIQTNTRDINRYVLKLNTVNGDTNPVLIDLYVSHLKSSQGGSNVTERLDMVTRFTNTLPTLDPDSNIIFAGDLNVYTSTEPGYIELLDNTNAIPLVDPINTPGAWNNNQDFVGVHTQSTRVSSGPFGTGAGGGMDDRFDFMLISENMMSNPKLRYVPGSYKAYGNNGNCFNLSVNDPSCTGEFAQNLRTNLYTMSDHLPVVMELETDQEIVILNGTDIDANFPKLKLHKTLVHDELTIEYLNPSQPHIRLSILNILGQEVWADQWDAGGTKTVLISSLASGIYYLNSDLPLATPLKFVKD